MNFKSLISALAVVSSVVAQDTKTIYSTILHSVTINEPGVVTSTSVPEILSTKPTSTETFTSTETRFTSYLTTTSTYQSLESHEPTYTSTIYLTSTRAPTTSSSSTPIVTSTPFSTTTEEPLTITSTNTITSTLSSSFFNSSAATTLKPFPVNSTSTLPASSTFTSVATPSSFNSSVNFGQTKPTLNSSNGSTVLSMSLSLLVLSLVSTLF